jgi:hypothetical protein
VPGRFHDVIIVDLRHSVSRLMLAFMPIPTAHITRVNGNRFVILQLVIHTLFGGTSMP